MAVKLKVSNSIVKLGARRCLKHLEAWKNHEKSFKPETKTVNSIVTQHDSTVLMNLNVMILYDFIMFFWPECCEHQRLIFFTSKLGFGCA